MRIKNTLRPRSGRAVAGARALASAMTALLMAGTGWTASRPASVSQVALYQGADRQQILIEGAKKEGQVMFYNSNTWLSSVAREFEKKYPFIKVSVWRSDSKNVVKRVSEEYASGRFLADVVETTDLGLNVLQKKGIFQEYYSPEAAAYGDEVKSKGKSGVYYLADREIYIGLGFNTNLIPATEAPKSYRDLLEPKWKGRISFTNTDTGVRWIGNALNTMGRNYLEKLSQQEIKVQNIPAAALAGLIVSGEVPLSPTIFDSNIFTARKTGAPVDWRPLEPVVTNIGSSGITAKAPHPHAALLFLDYLHSREGQKVVMNGGLGSPRDDVGSSERKFKKTYFEGQYPIEEFEKKFNEWDELIKRLFLRKR